MVEKNLFYNKNSEYFKNLLKILTKNDLDSYKKYIKTKIYYLKNIKLISILIK